MITVEQAKELKKGKVLHHKHLKNGGGSCARWRVNGAVRRWKRQPDRVEVPLKRELAYYFLSDYFLLTNIYLRYFHLVEDCRREGDERPY